tara:strand:- start:337 stop:972 length:636 start_codon:yes stop_codon:yes gene_type:complete
MSTTDISIAQEAVSRIGKGTIASLEETSTEASEAAFHLPLVLEEMAEWTEWPELVKRVTLAQAANDRPAEWEYAYAAPSDMSDPIAVRGAEEAATSLPERGPYTLPVQDAYPIRFLAESGKIYTNTENAILVYTRENLTAQDLRPLMRRAAVDELAARLALSVKRDAKLADQMARAAEMSRGRAIADARNRSPDFQDRYVSEAELAREGLL